MKKGTVLIALAGILLLGGFLRFYQITEIPLGLFSDEAMNGNNALEAWETGRFKVFYPENNGREGLFIMLQAFALRLLANEAWALRLVSALAGTLTILGMYLVAKELVRNSRAETVALLAAFFTATSYWHINFSRLGFRAILVPLCATFALFFLLKGLRKETAIHLIIGGIITGLGFYTYIAFRFMPFVMLVPLVGFLTKKKTGQSCAPCLIMLFIFIALLTALPLGYYFLQHPQDFIGRTQQISIFAAVSPLKEFLKSSALTVQMFFWRGDCNWRHNYACAPQLNPIVALFFLAGITALWRLRKSDFIKKWTLVAWLIAMSLPVILTSEGLPHALRSIGMIPPVMILAALGVYHFAALVLLWLERKKAQQPGNERQLRRIQKEFLILLAAALLFIPLATYRTYFFRWAGHPETYFALSTDVFHLGQFLKGLPETTQKIVVTDVPWPRLREIGAPAQTVMFVTDTFIDDHRRAKNFEYLTVEEFLNRTPLPRNTTILVALLNDAPRHLAQRIQKKFPEFQIKVPGDFIVLQNY